MSNPEGIEHLQIPNHPQATSGGMTFYFLLEWDIYRMSVLCILGENRMCTLFRGK